MKKLNFYKTLFIILILSIIIISILVAIKYIKSYKNEKNIKQTINLINNETSKEEDSTAKIDAEVKGNKVVGIIKISKINLEYPILETTSKETLNLSITKFWGQQINQIGNVTLAGHNNLNGKMFGNIKKLQVGDIIELTDMQNVKLQYVIYKTYITDPNDISCIKEDQEGDREVTLITCTNGNKNRFIVKARETK